VRIECIELLKSKKKRNFNAADIFDAGGDEKQVFFGVALVGCDFGREASNNERIFGFCVLSHVF